MLQILLDEVGGDGPAANLQQVSGSGVIRIGILAQLADPWITVSELDTYQSLKLERLLIATASKAGGFAPMQCGCEPSAGFTRVSTRGIYLARSVH